MITDGSTNYKSTHLEALKTTKHGCQQGKHQCNAGGNHGIPVDLLTQVEIWMEVTECLKMVGHLPLGAGNPYAEFRECEASGG